MSDTEERQNPKSGDDLPNDRENGNGNQQPERMEEEPQQSKEDGDRAASSDSRRGGENRGDRQIDDELRAKRVFVGNLNFRTSWQQLKDFMKKIGKVERVEIFQNRDGQSKGYGLVQFSNGDEATRAVKEMNQADLDGRKIFVREDDARQTKTGAPRDKPRRERRSPRRGSPRRRSNSRSRSRSRSFEKERRHRSDRRRSRSRSGSNSRRDNRRRDRSRSRSRSRSKDNNRRGGSRDRRDRDRDDRKSGRDGFQLCVRNMPWSVTWQQLKDAFKEYGTVLRADVPQDDKGRSKGFGYVKFEREKEALKAIDGMHGAAFNGRKIQVEFS